jgi:hypothetical protein
VVRALHNEGDGGIWENFDRRNAEIVADAVLAALDGLPDTTVRRDAGQEAAGDRNCYTLPDGSCVGGPCMHDAICGESAQTLVGSGPRTVCTLSAGHAGWHRDDSGMSWQIRPAAPTPGDLGDRADEAGLRERIEALVKEITHAGLAESGNPFGAGWNAAHLLTATRLRAALASPSGATPGGDA